MPCKLSYALQCQDCLCHEVDLSQALPVYWDRHSRVVLVMLSQYKLSLWCASYAIYFYFSLLTLLF